MEGIVAVDRLWGIGSNGELLFHIKEDMEFFKKITTNKIVVMGRKTLESLPNGEPLKNRTNLIVTSNKSYENHDNVVFGNIDEIREEINKYNTDDVIIIGGGSIYKQFMHECDTFYVTHNCSTYMGADTYISNLAFEGFKMNKIINRGTTSDGSNWVTAEWTKDIFNPYKSVLWFSSNNNILFAHSDDLKHWKGIFSDNHLIFTDEFKSINYTIINSLFKLNKYITMDKINGCYKYEFNIASSKGYLRIAVFADTARDAYCDLISVLHELAS